MKNITDISHLPTSQKQLLNKLLDLGANLLWLENTQVVVVKYKGREHLFVGDYTPLVPHNIGLIISNKFFVSQLLKHDKISTPNTIVIEPPLLHVARTAVRKLGFPTVIKLENSQLATTSKIISNMGDLPALFSEFERHQTGILLQEFCAGITLRVFYHQLGYFQVIQETGGNQQVEITDQVHSSLIKIAQKVLQSIAPMTYVSFRIIVDSINKPLTSKKYAVIELYHSAVSHYGFLASNEQSSELVETILARTILD